MKESLEHIVGPFPTGGAGPYPTLILLHGRGSNEQDLMGLAPYFDPRFFLIAVRAPLAFPYGGYTWYSMEEVGSPNPGEFEGSYSRLAAFVDDARSNYPVDPKQIYLMGFSMGTVMAFSLALTKPDAIRGVVAHSGYIPEQTSLQFEWGALDKTGFFVAHGSEDPVIPVKFGRRSRELLEQSGADLSYHEYPIGHHVSDESVRDLSQWLRGRLDGRQTS